MRSIFPVSATCASEVQQSRILGEINARVPPSRLLDAIARVDPFLAIRGPEANVAPPDPALLASPAVRDARSRVFRITGSACGLGISGSGWAAAPNLVVTNAHVVAGMKDPRVDLRDGDYHDADVVAFNVHDDIAVLRVAGLGASRSRRPTRSRARPSRSSATPRTDPSPPRPGGSARPAVVLAEDAYGRGPVNRKITTLRGGSGTATRAGLRSTAAAACGRRSSPSRVGADNQGYGVPTDIVQSTLADAREAAAVSTGPCVG